MHCKIQINLFKLNALCGTEAQTQHLESQVEIQIFNESLNTKSLSIFNAKAKLAEHVTWWNFG